MTDTTELLAAARAAHERLINAATEDDVLSAAGDLAQAFADLDYVMSTGGTNPWGIS